MKTPRRRQATQAQTSVPGQTRAASRKTTGRPGAHLGRLLTLGALAIGLGHVQAVVGVYLREMAGGVPLPEGLSPDAVGSMPGWIIAVEQTREVAAAVALTCLCLLVARTPRARLGSLALMLGLATLTYHASTKLMIDWPGSLAATNLVALTPGAYYLPVWATILCGCALVAAGLSLLRAGKTP